jgi:hypothetical protein
MSPRDVQDQERLKEFFRLVHQDPAPPFETLVCRQSDSKVLGWRLAVTAAAAVAMVVITLLVLALPSSDGPALGDREALALAGSISTWEGPLDFLLETPAHEIFDAPIFLAPMPDIPSVSDSNNKEKSS